MTQSITHDWVSVEEHKPNRQLAFLSLITKLPFKVMTDYYRAKLCSIPPVCQLNISAKNPAGSYGKQEEYPETILAKARTQFLTSRASDFSDAFVINPGSRYLKIGKASDPLPKIVPHLIAHRKGDISEVQSGMKFTREDDAFFSDVFANLFSARIQTLKRKPMPSAPGQVHNFNSNSEPRTIPEHNDPYAIDWTAPTEDSKYFCGEEAKYLDNSQEAFIHKYPIRMGTFNLLDYDDIHQVLLDLARIWEYSLRKDFEILHQKDLNEFSCLLILPDNVNAKELNYWSILVIRILGFKAVAFLQESVASAFGSGIATGCVLDIGSQKTSFACVEDGFLLPDSSVLLPYGGDSLTKLFLEFLNDAAFPYVGANLNDPADFDLISELKSNSITFQESDTFNVSTFEFYVRKPATPTLHYNVKMYEERIMTPMALFTPNSIPTFVHENINYAPLTTESQPDESKGKEGEGEEGGEQEVKMETSEKSPEIPTLDEALLRSMCAGSEGEERIERINKFKGSIILVGGESSIPHFDSFLQLKMTQLFERIEGLSDTSISFFKGPSKDLDPKMIPWKGGCVFCKIECSNDYWTCAEEFNAKSLKSISKRVNFSIKLD